MQFRLLYPNGRVIDYNYGTSGGIDDKLSRLKAIEESTTELAAYTYLGAGMVVQVDYTEPDIRYDLITGTGDDPYDGLDRFIDCCACKATIRFTAWNEWTVKSTTRIPKIFDGFDIRPPQGSPFSPTLMRYSWTETVTFPCGPK